MSIFCKANFYLLRPSKPFFFSVSSLIIKTKEKPTVSLFRSLSNIKSNGRDNSKAPPCSLQKKGRPQKTRRPPLTDFPFLISLLTKETKQLFPYRLSFLSKLKICWKDRSPSGWSMLTSRFLSPPAMSVKRVFLKKLKGLGSHCLGLLW